MTIPKLPPLPDLNWMQSYSTKQVKEMMRDYGKTCTRAAIEAATLAERERCAKEAEHWQTISATPGHACGQYIAAAIRLPLPPTATPQGNPND